MFRHPDHYVTDFQSLCGGDTNCIMQDWEYVCEAMVEKLLAGEDDGPLQDVLPDKTLLSEMVCACLDKLRRQKGGLIRKSELGGFLKQKIGGKYRRGWLKQVVHTMMQKGLVQNAATPDMVKIQGAMMPKWCHFSNQCKYFRRPEDNHLHFKLFVHLCPEDSDCPYVVAYLRGDAMTPDALEHFQSWKHKCPQGTGCWFHKNSNVFKEHALVFTHKAALGNA